MPPRPFVNDALWRCLCPGFPSNATALQAARAGAITPLRNSHLKRTTPRQPQHQARPYSAAASTVSASSSFFAQPHTPSPTSRPQHSARQPRNGAPKPSLVHMPTHLLYEDLRLAGSKGQFDHVMHICNVLVKDRGQRPDKEMYAAVLHSFTSSVDGTAGKVRKVLEEMGFWDESAEGRVELHARGCENVLEALAVHPDYLLRAEILEHMRARWFTLSDRGHNFVVAGLLRERHFEQALEMLEGMCRKKVRVEEWLFSEATWLLLEFGEVEEAFYVLGLKESASGTHTPGAAMSVKLSNALWGALLDAAAHQHLHDAARLVWTIQVQPGYLKPPTGTCVSVLSLASRHGDVQLATDVFRLLTERETTFTTHHYELLIAAYLNANALSDALSVILIMTDANLKVDSATCHPLFWYLRNAPAPATTDGTDTPSLPLHTFTLLQDLHAQGHKIPPALPNTLIAAAIAQSRLPDALEIYKALHSILPSGPNTETFNALLRGCSTAARKDIAMHLVSEMIALNLSPDRITYDRLILVCEQSGDIDDAVSYFEEMRSLKLRPRRGTYERLVERLCEARDGRAVAVLRDYKASGEGISPGLLRRVGEVFGEVSMEAGTATVQVASTAA